MAYGFKSGGRQKGTPNRISGEMKDILEHFVKKHGSKLDTWIDRMKPQEAAACYFSAMEYVQPKLARTEHAGDKNNPVEHRVTVQSDAEILKRYLSKEEKP